MKMSEVQDCYYESFGVINSDATINLYKYALGRLTEFLGDIDVKKVTLEKLESYFNFLRKVYKPKRMNGDVSPLSASTLRNHWKAIRSFFAYCLKRKHTKTNVALELPCPKENSEAIDPMSKEEVEELLNAVVYAKPSKPGNRKAFTMHRRTYLRDFGITLVLLDIGIRGGELERLKVCDFDKKKNTIYIAPYGSSDHKTKPRELLLHKNTASALKEYLASRQEREEKLSKGEQKNLVPTAPLFMGDRGKGVTENGIRLLYADLSEKAGIKHVHPHRFRHTFATEYLRNGGNIYTLQGILGHSDLKTCRVYLKIVEADILNSQKLHSPVGEWNLSSTPKKKPELKQDVKPIMRKSSRSASNRASL